MGFNLIKLTLSVDSLLEGSVISSGSSSSRLFTHFEVGERGREGNRSAGSLPLLVPIVNLFLISCNRISLDFFPPPSFVDSAFSLGMDSNMTAGNYEPTPSNFGASSSALTLDSPPIRVASANAPNASRKDSGAFFRDARM